MTKQEEIIEKLKESNHKKDLLIMEYDVPEYDSLEKSKYREKLNNDISKLESEISALEQNIEREPLKTAVNCKKILQS